MPMMSKKLEMTLRQPLAWLAGAGVVLAALALAHAASAPSAVSEALDRPALEAREPGHAMLLGAARTGQRLVTVGERGLILLSDDQGKHWRQVASPVSVTLTAVRFDQEQGVIVGHGGVILTSDDGGQRWSLRMDGRKAAALALAAAKLGGHQAAIDDAQRLLDDGPDKPFFDVLNLGRGHLMVVGAYGLALESRDGGAQWQAVMERFDNPKGLHYYALRRDGEQLLLAGEQGMLQLSSDGGKSFRRLATPYQGSFFTAELTPQQGIVVAGLRGQVWQSRDQGQSWTQLVSPVTASITASLQQADGTLVLSNQAGMLLRPQGTRLQLVNQAPLPAVNGLLALDGGKLAVLTGLGTLIVDSATEPQAPK